MSGWKDTPQARREIVVWHLLAASENLLRSQAELATQGLHELGRKAGADATAFDMALEELGWDTIAKKWRDEEAK